MQFIRFKFTATVKVQLLNRTQFLNNNQFNSNNPYNSPNYQNQVRELKSESDLSEEFVVLRYITIFSILSSLLTEKIKSNEAQQWLNSGFKFFLFFCKIFLIPF